MDKLEPPPTVEPIATFGPTEFNRVTVRVCDPPLIFPLVARPPLLAVLPVDVAQRSVGLSRVRAVGASFEPVLQVLADYMNDDETPVTSAHRQLRAAGLHATIELLSASLLTAPDYSTEQVTLAIATDLTVAYEPDIDLTWIPFDSLADEIGQTRDLKTYALLLSVMPRLVRGNRATTPD